MNPLAIHLDNQTAAVRKTLAVVGATLLLSVPVLDAVAQELPPRQIGSLDVNALTSAPLWTIRSAEINAAPADVFAYVSENANWPGWFKGVTGVSSDSSTRTFTLDGGGELIENIVAFDEPSVFAWSLAASNPMGLKNHLGVIHVVPDEEDGQGSFVTLSNFFDHANVDEILQIIEGSGKAILDAVTAEFGGSLALNASGNKLVTILTTRVANVPTAAVWKTVAEDFDDVAEWASVISEAKFFGDDKQEGLLGGTRQCFIPAFGSSVEERVVSYDEHAGEFAYEVIKGMPPFVSQGFNTWNIDAIDEKRTRISTTTTMQIAPGTPGFPIGMAKQNFGHVLSISLDELVYFVERGEPHPREIASR